LQSWQKRLIGNDIVVHLLAQARGLHRHSMVGYHNLQNCGSLVPNISHPEHCSGHLRKVLRVPTTAELELSTPVSCTQIHVIERPGYLFLG
jgi:hypothetical protein